MNENSQKFKSIDIYKFDCEITHNNILCIQYQPNSLHFCAYYFYLFDYYYICDFGHYYIYA